MRKVITSISFLMLLSSSVSAADYRDEFYSMITNAGLNQQAGQYKGSSVTLLREEIGKLEQENESLRNSISKLRTNYAAPNKTARDASIKSLMHENMRLTDLLSAVNNSGAGNINTAQISDLKNENLKLQQTLNKVIAQSGNKQVTSQQIQDLGRYKSENARLKSYIESGSDNSQLISMLQAKLEQSQQENKALAAASINPAAGMSRDVKALKAQNQSLRDTISAQSDMLRTVDGSGKKDDKLANENITLQKKLEKAQKEGSTSIQFAKELYLRNKILQNKVDKRDDYIKAQKSKSHSIRQNYGRSQSLSMLRDQNEILENALKKERRSITSYRTKIQSYQDRIDGDVANERDENSDNFMPLNDEKEDFGFDLDVDSNSDNMVSLLLENQELKARIDLLSDGM